MRYWSQWQGLTERCGLTLSALMSFCLDSLHWPRATQTLQVEKNIQMENVGSIDFSTVWSRRSFFLLLCTDHLKFYGPSLTILFPFLGFQSCLQKHSPFDDDNDEFLSCFPVMFSFKVCLIIVKAAIPWEFKQQMWDLGFCVHMLLFWQIAS